MFRGVKIFTPANKGPEYNIVTDLLGWLQENPQVRVLEKVVTESTDSSSHHLSIVLYYEE